MAFGAPIEMAFPGKQDEETSSTEDNRNSRSLSPSQNLIPPTKEALKQRSDPVERFEPWALAREPLLQKLFIQRTSDKSLTIPHILYMMAPSV